MILNTVAPVRQGPSHVKYTECFLMPSHKLYSCHICSIKSFNAIPSCRIENGDKVLSLFFSTSCLSKEARLTLNSGCGKHVGNICSWQQGTETVEPASKPYPVKRKYFPATDTVFNIGSDSSFELKSPSTVGRGQEHAHQSARVLAHLEQLDLSGIILAKCLKHASCLSEEDVINLLTTLSKCRFSRVQLRSMLSKFPALVKVSASQVKEYLEYYNNLGFTSPIVNSLFVKRPALLACDLKKASQVIEVLISMGIEKDDLSVILSRRPHILELDVNSLEDIVSTLKKTGISQSDVTRLLKRAPAVFTPSEDDIHKSLDFWVSIGVRGKYLCRALLRRPNLLSYNIKSMMRTYSYLQQWVDANDLLKLVSRFAELLAYDPETKIKPLINYFLRLGLNENDIGKVILRRPQLMSCTIHRLDMTVNYLKTLGVKDDMMGKVLTTSPQVFTLNAKDKLKRGVDFFRSVGLVKERDMEFLFSRNAQIFCCSIEKNLQPTIDFFLNMGLDKDALAKMIVLFPSMLGQNVEQSLAPKYSYLIDDMKRPVQEIIEFPQYFGYSLEKRIKPRHKLLSERGLYRSLASMLACTDNDFYNRYVLPYSVSSQRMGVPEGKDILRKRTTMRKRQSTTTVQSSLSANVSTTSNADVPSCSSKNKPLVEISENIVTDSLESAVEQAEGYPDSFKRYYKNLSPCGIWIHAYKLES